MNGGRVVAAALVICVGALCGPAWADEVIQAKKTNAVDPTGNWKWEYSLNDDPTEFTLNLHWDGKELTGKYTAFGKTTDIEDATFKDGKLSFISKREFSDNEFTVAFAGELKPNDIEGTVAVDFGDGPREFAWHATRAADFAAILGTWKLKLDTPNGVIEPELTITQDGSKFKGHYVSVFGEREAKDVAFENGELSWRIKSGDDDEFEFAVAYRGKPEGDQMAGSVEYDFGGNTGTLEFTGERTPPKQEASPAKPAAEAEPIQAAEAATTPAATNSK